MQRRHIFLSFTLLTLGHVALGNDAQSLKSPVHVSQDFLQDLIAQSRAEQLKLSAMPSAKLAPDAQAAVKERRIRSIPTWSGSFTYQGFTYPYTMVGGDPKAGDSAVIDTALIPISLVFPGYIGQGGLPITLDVTPVIDLVQHSPIFVPSAYSSGYTQFGDAVQRAEFYGAFQYDWHTLLNPPRLRHPVTVTVPNQFAKLFLAGDILFALIDQDFFESQLNTIMQLEGLRVSEFAIALTRNVFLSSGNFTVCCTLGLHNVMTQKVANNKSFLQTWAYATWMDSGVYPDPDYVDVLPLSHEVAEWLNDPFVNNFVPQWQNPNGAGCGGNLLETGDPVDVLPGIAYPVTVSGYTYHVQTEALLQWFSREQPSSAIGQAYSFPDTSLLTTPSAPCFP